MPGTDYPTGGERAALWSRLTDALIALPTTDAVAVSSALPLTANGSTVGEVEIDGREIAVRDDRALVRVVVVGPGYFAALGLGLHQGRDLRADDGGPDGERVLVDRRFVEVYFPESQPIGARVWNPRVSLLIMLVIAIASLGVAGVGVYAITAHGVATRRREIGVRLALGAPARQVRWLVMRRVLLHLLVGLAVGAVLAAVSPFATGNAVGWGAAVFILVAAGSAWGPVLRATRLDPATVLRWE